MKNLNFKMLVIICLVGTLSQISTDIYTPSLPYIAHYFNASMGQVQLTLTWFMFGVAATTLIYGPVSEVIGRRWTVLLGNVIAIVGTFVCLFSPSIYVLQIGRLLQGAGIGASATVWRSIFRDSYSGEEMAKVASYLINIIILSVILAPFVGGYIQQYMGWHAVFVFLAVWIMMVSFIVLFAFNETSQHHGKHRLKLSFIFNAYKELLLSRKFVGFSLTVFLTFGGLFTWMTAGPIILIHGIGIQPVEFGYLMIFSGIAMGLGGFINGKLIKFLGCERLLLCGFAIMFIAGAITLLGYLSMGLTVYNVVVPAFIFVLGVSLVFPNASSMAFTPFGHIAGYAASLYSAIQLLGGVVFSAIVSHLNSHNQLAMAWMFIASAFFAALTFILLAKSKN